MQLAAIGFYFYFYFHGRMTSKGKVQIQKGLAVWVVQRYILSIISKGSTERPWDYCYYNFSNT